MAPLNNIEAGPSNSRKASGSFPAVRLTETRDHMTVVALVPGFSEGDLEITLVKDVLHIAGRYRAGVPRDFSPLHRGRRSGDFNTEIKLLADVAWSAPDVELERGVLALRLRKDKPASRSKIPIRIA